MISMPAFCSRTSLATTSNGIASSALPMRRPTSAGYAGESALPVCFCAAMIEPSCIPDSSLSAGFSCSALTFASPASAASGRFSR